MEKNSHTPSLKLSLGPVLFFWPKEKLLQFYEQAARWPVHTIYLGETVCARRYEMRVEDWIDLAKDLSTTGKEIILSSQVLLETEIDLRRLRKYVEQGDFKIEANDLGAVKLARDNSLPFVAGQTLNIYNEDTLKLYQSMGAVRWVPPVEISGKQIGEITHKCPDIACEVFGWGFIPLAFSARCFTARYYNLRKDLCEFKCQEHPNALTIKTQEGQPFLTINGIETMSAGCQSLIGQQQALSAMGVDMLRLSPQFENMEHIVQLHDQYLQGCVDVHDMMDQLRDLAPGELVDGFWHGKAGATTVGEILNANT